MVAMNVNTNTYACDISTSAQTITFTGTDADATSVIIENPSTTAILWVVSSKTGAALTAAFPAAGSKGPGKPVGPGKTQTYTKNAGDDLLSVLGSAADTEVDAYVSIGAGE